MASALLFIHLSNGIDHDGQLVPTRVGGRYIREAPLMARETDPGPGVRGHSEVTREWTAEEAGGHRKASVTRTKEQRSHQQLWPGRSTL